MTRRHRSEEAARETLRRSGDDRTDGSLRGTVGGRAPGARVFRRNRTRNPCAGRWRRKLRSTIGCGHMRCSATRSCRHVTSRSRWSCSPDVPRSRWVRPTARRSSPRRSSKSARSVFPGRACTSPRRRTRSWSTSRRRFRPMSESCARACARSRVQRDPIIAEGRNAAGIIAIDATADFVSGRWGPSKPRSSIRQRAPESSSRPSIAPVSPRCENGSRDGWPSWRIPTVRNERFAA